MSLIPAHGGLSEPVDRVLPLSQQKSLLKEAKDLPKIAVTDADLSAVYRLGDGTLSPLIGPMTETEWHHALDHKSIVRDGKRYAWTIPISLPITNDEAKKLETGKNAALVNARGQVVGVLTVGSVFEWDKTKYIEKVYLTTRTDHPGADIVLKDDRTKLVGGELYTLPQPPHPEFGSFVLSPRLTRAMIQDRKWQAALAFQTRNPLHRAHEYALVYGVETLTRQGLYAGVVLNPLVGELKGDDVDAATRMRTYAALKNNRALGQGDSDRALWESVGYDLNDVFALVGLDIRMFYGGPSEAIMHSIYRQNHGFTHLVIGRKHADAPYHDKTPIWGDFDAQQIFEDLPGDLQVKPVKVGFAAYYESMGRVDLTENHPNEKPFSISGTQIRAELDAGNRPDERIMRPETADILIEVYRRQREAKAAAG
ncbi:MAG: sulfate adenylyltransferase [bacterium]